MKYLILILTGLVLSSCGGSGGGSGSAATSPAANIKVEITADQANINTDIGLGVPNTGSVYNKSELNKIVNDQVTYIFTGYAPSVASTDVTKKTTAGSLRVKHYKNNVLICDETLTQDQSTSTCILN